MQVPTLTLTCPEHLHLEGAPECRSYITTQEVTNISHFFRKFRTNSCVILKHILTGKKHCHLPTKHGVKYIYLFFSSFLPHLFHPRFPVSAGPGATPSTPSSVMGSSSKLLAKALWEAMAAARRRRGGTPLARAAARRRMKSAASSDHRPPVSRPTTMRRHRAACWRSG